MIKHTINNNFYSSIMKKHMILAAGVALVTAAISVFAFVNNEKNSIDELFNANVEALADNENVCYYRYLNRYVSILS